MSNGNPELAYVRLSQIVYNPAINARGSTESDLTEICATLKSHGFVQQLMVRPVGNDIFEPADGGRRYHAAMKLVEDGIWPADTRIPVMIRDMTDAEAIEMSLAAAVTRLELNPADEVRSFARLIADGTTAAELAAHFGVPPRRVAQRLAIAGLPARIVSALHDGAITLAQAEAFTVGRDARHVLELFDGLRQDSWQARPENIRNALTQKRAAADCREAVYVGREAYLAAGGTIDEDLFSNDAWFVDIKLLDKLFWAKIAEEEKRLMAEGWSFVAINLASEYTGAGAGWPRATPEGKPNLTKEQKASRDALKAEVKHLDKQLRSIEEGDDEDALEAQMTAAQDELRGLLEGHFTDAQKKTCGAIIGIEGGQVRVKLGIMKPATAKQQAKAKASKQKARDTSQDPSAVRNVTPDAEADFTGALQEEMARAMTHGMQAAIIAKPELALRATAAALLIATRYATGGDPFLITADRQRLRPSDNTKAAFDDLGSEDDDVASLFAGLAQQPHEPVASAIAKCMALLFRIPLAVDDWLKPLIDAFDPDVSSIWWPGEDFFKKMPRDMLAAALGEAAVPGVTPGKKKKEMVEMALRALPAMGWLPKPLRTPSYKGPGSNAWSQAHADQVADQVKTNQAAA